MVRYRNRCFSALPSHLVRDALAFPCGATVKPTLFALFIVCVVFALVAPALFPVPTYPDPSIMPRPYKQWAGNAYTVYFGIDGSKADSETEHNSTAQLYEDGKPLGPAHVSFSDVATLGHGRYMHYMQDFMQGMVVFSSSDGTDPNTNGRVYRLYDPYAYDPLVKPAERISDAAQPRPRP